MLRELADEGRIERRRKKLHQPGTLPHVVLADITARDRDGELIAVPTEWDEEAHGPPPKIRIATTRRAAAGRGRRRRRPRAAARRGDRRRGRGDPPYRPRHQDHRPRQAARARHFPGAAGRRRPAAPIDKKQLGRELAIPPGAGADAQDGDLVAVEVASSRSGYGLASARVKERLGSLKSERAVSLIAIHAHGIPHVFPPAALREAEAAQPATLAGREDWRDVPFVTIDPPDAKDHDDAVHAGAGCRSEQSRRPRDQRRHRRRRPLCAAGLGARPRGADARQLGLFPRPRGADAARAHLQRPVLAAAATRTARRSRCASSSAPTAASARTRSTAC